MKAFLIARLTLKRMLRAYYLMPAALMALVVIGLYLGTAKAAGGHPQHLLLAASWSIMLISDVFVYIGSILLVVFILPDELASGHMRMNLTKPVSGFSVLLGHFLAMFFYLAAAALFMAALLTMTVMLKGGEPGFLIITYIVHQLPLYGCILAAGFVMVLLFNRPMAFFILFFLAKDAWLFEKATLCDQPFPIKQALQSIYYSGYLIAPPISKLDISIVEFARLAFPYDKYLLLLAYSISYTLIALLISEWLLRRKEI